MRDFESMGERVKRAALAHLDAAMDALRRPNEDAAHTARRHLRQLRGLLRLARRGLGESAYRRDRTALREVARSLSGVRDAQAALSTLSTLTGHDLPSRTVDALERALRVEQRVRTRACNLASIAAQLQRVRRFIARWPPADLGWRNAGHGLRATLVRTQDAADAAHRQPTDEALHTWRKRVKDLRAQIGLLRTLDPEHLAPLHRTLHALSAALGDDHDLAMLRRWLDGQSLDDAARASTAASISRRRRSLQRRAFALEHTIDALRPRPFVRELRERCRAVRAQRSRHRPRSSG